MNADDRVIKHLAQKGKVAVMTKAASFLLWYDDFTKIRNYLLDHIAWMISDASGIPPSYAGPAGFEQITYGDFVGPYFIQDEHTRAGFVKLWAKQPHRPLPFRFGYPDSAKHNHLMITRPSASALTRRTARSSSSLVEPRRHAADVRRRPPRADRRAAAELARLADRPPRSRRTDAAARPRLDRAQGRPRARDRRRDRRRPPSASTSSARCRRATDRAPDPHAARAGGARTDRRRVALAFAIKEAIYKAVDPVVRRYVGFTEVELDLEAGRATSALPLDVAFWWTELAAPEPLWLATARATPR